MAALERLYLVFGDAAVERSDRSDRYRGFRDRAPRFYFEVSEIGLPQTRPDSPLDDVFIAINLFVHNKRCRHVTIDSVERALRHVFSRPCKQTRKLARRLDRAGAIMEEDSPSFEPRRSSQTEPEEDEEGFLIAGPVLIPGREPPRSALDDSWYPSMEAFFDDPDNFDEWDFDDPEPEGPCGCEGDKAFRCHDVCNCLLTTQLFGVQHRTLMAEGQAIAARRTVERELDGLPLSSRWTPGIEERVDRALHALAHESEQELDARAARGEEVGGLRRVRHCPRYLGEVRKHDSFKAWQLRGRARPAEELAAAGYTVEPMPLMKYGRQTPWPGFE